MERNLLPLNLQFFAEDPAGDAAGPAGADGTDAADAAGVAGGDGQDTVDLAEGKEAVREGKSGTGDSQSGDPAVDVQKLVQEEMKKAAMSPEERAKYEADEREKTLKEREDAISLRERTADAKELLAENGLPVSFTEMVIGKDKAATEENVKAFKSQYDTAVQAQVEKRLSGRTPDAGSGVSGARDGDALLNEILSYL